jgi:proton-dependent oligopeptide transporter, POT family
MSIKSTSLPRGAWLIIMIEFWERFSFYGMLSLLALFLTANPAESGFGWTKAQTLTLVGLYSGLMYGLPAFGGIAADRYWGHRRAVLLGGICLVIGHFLMAGPHFVPLFLGGNAVEALAALPVLGEWKSPDGLSGTTALAYQWQAMSFYGALVALVLGNALFKASLAILLGQQFDDEDPRRDEGYAYYYLAINFGGVVAGLAVGWAGQAYGWHVGFSLAGFGMATALLAYLLLGHRLLRPEPKPNEIVADAQPILNGGQRFALLGVLAFFLFVFEVGWFQLYGSWALFFDSSVNRDLGGFSIPVPWFEAFNSAVVIMITPFIVRHWVRRSARGDALDIVTKYGFALLAMAAASGVMAAVSMQGGRVSALWPLIAIALLSIGEAVAWISTYSVVYAAAPPQSRAAAMGIWYMLTLGAGGWAAGKVGSGFAGAPLTLFAVIAGLCALSACILIAGRHSIRRWATSLKISL